MSRYILDINSDIAKSIVVFGMVGERGISTVFKIDELKELTTDYINEHFGDLQDTAYQKGINDGSLDVKQRVEGAYQKGLEDGKAVHDKGCEGCKYANVAGTHEPCVRCSNSYGNQWTAKDDKIEVGDEVEWLGDRFIVTRIFQPRNGKEQCDGIDSGGYVYRDILMDDLEKTGRHFDIASILEAMKA